MPPAGAHGPTPLFSPAQLRHELLPCPPIGRPSSLLSRRIRFYYIYEWLLKPRSEWYCQWRDIHLEAGAYPLPFNLILKNNPRIREQESLAMNLARAMGVPAPRFISFIEPPPGYKFSDGEHGLPSLLMTRVPGIELDALADDQVDFDVVKDDIIRILTIMRSFSSPWGDAICGVDGGLVAGPLIPLTPLQSSSDQAAFYDLMRQIGGFSLSDKDEVAPAERFFALLPHAIVFTHGDLNRHNIMVGPDGHVTGIIDWESAAWLPDYWEVAITAIFPQRVWGRFMHETVTSGVYAEEVQGLRYMYSLIGDALRI